MDHNRRSRRNHRQTISANANGATETARRTAAMVSATAGAMWSELAVTSAVRTPSVCPPPIRTDAKTASALAIRLNAVLPWLTAS